MAYRKGNLVFANDGKLDNSTWVSSCAAPHADCNDGHTTAATSALVPGSTEHAASSELDPKLW